MGWTNYGDLFTQATRCGPKVQVLSGNVAIVLKTDWLPSWTSSVCHPKAVEATVMRKNLEVSAGFLLSCITSRIQQEQTSNTQQAPALQHLWSVRLFSLSRELKLLHMESPQFHVRWKRNNVGNPMMNLPSGDDLYIIQRVYADFGDELLLGLFWKWSRIRSSKLRHGTCLTRSRGSVRK
jgi:hypothetical protein